MIKNRPLFQAENQLKKRKQLKKKLIKLRKNSEKQNNRIVVDKDEEKQLENIVFNTNASIINQIDNNVNLISVDLNNFKTTETKNIENNLFIVDRKGDDRINIDIDNDGDDDSNDDELLNNNNIDDDDDDRLAEKFKSELFEKSLNNNESNDDDNKKSCVWYDEDDDLIASEAFDNCQKWPKLIKNNNDKYRQYLERKFTDIYEPPNWATKSTNVNKKQKYSNDDSDDNDDDNVEKIAFNQLKRNNFELDKEFLRLKKCPHLNQSSKIKTSLNCLDFHPKSTISLIGSPIGLVRLFQVDGRLNSMIQSIYFKGFCLCDAKFLSLNGQEEIIVGSDGSNHHCNGYCFVYDMLAGKILRINLNKGGRKHQYSMRGFQLSPNYSFLAACDNNNNGYINLLSSSSKELINEMKINGRVNCLLFSSDSNYLIAHGQETGCQAFIFDIRMAGKSQTIPCVNRFNDMDTIVATSMELSPKKNLLAIGSNMGTINIYRFDDLIKQSNVEPIKTVMNLTTSITSLKFNYDGQLLLMASNQKNDAIRFLNTNSMTVYKNFPLFVGSGGRTYGRIYDVNFSPNSGYASFVTGSGSAHLV